MCQEIPAKISDPASIAFDEAVMMRYDNNLGRGEFNALQRRTQMIRGKEGKISTDKSKVEVFVIPTNEEIVIARDTMALVTK